MTRGPRPIPDELNQLRGNPGKRRRKNADAPEFESAIPAPPEYLKGGALEEWERVTQIMADLQIITKLDRAIIAAYCWVCNELAENIEALGNEQRFYKSKRGAPTTNPRVRYVRDLLKQKQSLTDTLGFNPTARVRLKMVPTPKGTGESPRGVLAERLFGLRVAKK